MNTYLKALLMFAAVAGLYVPAVTVAAKSAGGVTGEARLHPGTWNKQRTSRSAARSRPIFRSIAPAIARTEPAPSAVAQAPTEQRSFSYEPSQPSVSGGCGDKADQAPATAQRSTNVRRSFSYEPSRNSYSAPRMKSRSSQKPAYLLPKTDPRKYRVH